MYQMSLLDCLINWRRKSICNLWYLERNVSDKEKMVREIGEFVRGMKVAVSGDF